MSQVDLHLHTTCSDGRLTPAQLIELVAERGLRVVQLQTTTLQRDLLRLWKCRRNFHNFP
jgi:predicted metal-dependent phosphoesterase TrpH